MTLRMQFAGVLVLAMFLPIHAAAVEPLSTKGLAEHCAHYEDDPEGKDAVFCVRCVQGFIGGAVATDERVMLNVSAEKKETYAERAIRTRLPSRHMGRFGSTVYAEFCPGAAVPLKEVVEHVVVGTIRARLTMTNKRKQ